MIWGETGKPGYGLYDRALGASYITGIWDTLAILQIGNKDDMNSKSKEGELAKEILIDYMQDFQKRNPNLYVFSAHLDVYKRQVLKRTFRQQL